MTCFIDLRVGVVDYVLSGGSKAEAARRFRVSRMTVYNWLNRDNLSPKQHGPRSRKIDKDALCRYIDANPDCLLREMADHFGVAMSSLSRCLAKMGFSKKNNSGPWRQII